MLKLSKQQLNKTSLQTNKNIPSYVNIILCSKLLNNNFQRNSLYQYLKVTSAKKLVIAIK